MSLSNLLVPNNYNVWFSSLNSDNPISINTKGYLVMYWTAQTTDATPQVVFLHQVINNHAYTVESSVQALSTVGDALTWDTEDLVKYFGSVLSYVGNSYVVNFIETPLTGATVATTVSGLDINTVVTGVVGKVINWSGLTYIYF
jgi:hypothetical protein